MHTTTKGTLLVLTTAIVSGLSIFLNAYAVKGFDSSVFTFAKNVVVALLLAATILGFGMLAELKQLTRKQWFSLVGIGLIGGSIPFLLFFKGLQLASGTTAGFIHKTLFLWVALLAVVALKEKLNARYLVSAALLLVGTYLIAQPTQTLGIAHLLIAVAVALWAIETVWAKRVLSDMSGTVVAFGRMFFGSIFLLTFLFATGKAGTIVSMSSSQYLWILLTAALLYLYVTTYYTGLAYIPASMASSILVLGAPVTAALDFAFRGVAPTLSAAFGCLLLVVGVASILWFSTTVTPAKRGTVTHDRR